MFGSYHLTRYNMINDDNRQVLPVDKRQAVDENDGDYLAFDHDSLKDKLYSSFMVIKK